MGTYVGYNDATVVLSITTADPTNPRIDRVCLTVNDAYYTGALNNAVLQVVAGTPAGSPVAPALPANSISLATVAVGAGATAITNANITDTRVLVTTNIPESGDISSVSAGTGLSGGGSSGAVTLSIDTSVTADLTTAQTLTNKSLTSPRINLGITTDTSTSFTPAITDNGKLVTLSNTSSITVTIPPFSSVAYPVGAQLNFVGINTGTVTFAQGAGVTIVSTGATASAPALRARYSSATAVCISQDNWFIAGDISSVSAGTGLSGGGSSGAVTLSINTAVTADLTTAQTLTNKTLTSPLINLGVNPQTGTSYTTVLADNGKLVTLSNTSPITVTIPPFTSVAYPVGAQLNFSGLNTGTTTFAQGAGVTIVSTGATASAPALRARYSSATAICISQDNWLIAGDMS
jgi:hypothetical protein